MPGGRPAEYKTPKELQEAIDNYFAECESDEKCPNIMGLTYFLGFASNQSLFDQQNRDQEFSDTIKRAKLRMWSEKMNAAASGKMNPTIFIFDSVNNHGMINTRSEGKNEHTGKDGGPMETKWTIETVRAEDKE